MGRGLERETRNLYQSLITYRVKPCHSPPTLYRYSLLSFLYPSFLPSFLFPSYVLRVFPFWYIFFTFFVFFMSVGVLQTGAKFRSDALSRPLINNFHFRLRFSSFFFKYFSFNLYQIQSLLASSMKIDFPAMFRP